MPHGTRWYALRVRAPIQYSNFSGLVKFGALESRQPSNLIFKKKLQAHEAQSICCVILAVLTAWLVLDDDLEAWLWHVLHATGYMKEVELKMNTKSGIILSAFFLIHWQLPTNQTTQLFKRPGHMTWSIVHWWYLGLDLSSTLMKWTWRCITLRISMRQTRPIIRTLNSHFLCRYVQNTLCCICTDLPV